MFETVWMDKIMEKKEGKKDKSSHCGVPQCNTYRGNGITMYHLPKEVRNCKVLLKKWSIALRMGKPFSKCFVICSRHFMEKDILRSARREGIRSRTMLVKGAFPTQNLPKSFWVGNAIDRSKRLLVHPIAIAKRRSKQEPVVELLPPSSTAETTVAEESQTCDQGVQVGAEVRNKEVQVIINPFITFTSLWDTEKKIKTMTGLPNISALNVLVKSCEKIRREDKMYMSMRDRILLTMYKLKSNASFAELAISFQVSDKTVELYFANTIQLLAKITKNLIYWQTKEHMRSLPTCFESFPNIRTILDCTEIRTVTFRCLSCKTCTYSHHKGSHTLKVLIGVSPSGSINYVSKAVTGKSSDSPLFNLSDLLDKLRPCDAVMVDKGFLIGDELSKAGIEIIRPELHLQAYARDDVERTTKIASPRVRVKRRIARLKIFKVLSEKVDAFIIPYIDDIMTVICGLSNLSSPILSDNTFLK